MFRKPTVSTSASRNTIRLLVAATTLVLLYYLLLDDLVGPWGPNRNMSINDFEEAEMRMPAISPVNNGSRILIVSAMFPLAKSKHSRKDYEIWLKNFLEPITTDIYIFTTPDLVDMLKQIRGDLPITINSSYSNPFEVPPLRGLQGTYTRMNDADTEKWHHSPGLYAVWNAKPFFLQSAVQLLAEQGEVYDYAFWNDGGSFRSEHRYTKWPDPGRTEQIWEEGSKLTGRNKEDLLFFPIFNLPTPILHDWQDSMGPIANPVQFSEGSFFGGTPLTIAWFSKVFYAYHDHYLSQWFFVGIDQNVFNVVLLLFPERIFTVWMPNPNAPAHRRISPSPILGSGQHAYHDFLGECGDKWFYYQFWLADRSTRDEMRIIWTKEERWSVTFGWQQKLCRMAGAVSMSDVLQISFGVDWKPPRRSIVIPGVSN